MSEPKLVTDWEAMCKDRDDEIKRLDAELTTEQSRSTKRLEALEEIRDCFCDKGYEKELKLVDKAIAEKGRAGS